MYFSVMSLLPTTCQRPHINISARVCALSLHHAGMLIGMVGNVMKQNSIAPPPQDSSMATDEEAGRGGLVMNLRGEFATRHTTGNELL